MQHDRAGHIDVQRMGVAVLTDADHPVAERPLLWNQPVAFIAEHEGGVADERVRLDRVGLGVDFDAKDRATAIPKIHLGLRQLEERHPAHAAPRSDRGSRRDAAAPDHDDLVNAERIRSSQERSEVGVLGDVVQQEVATRQWHSPVG